MSIMNSILINYDFLELACFSFLSLAFFQNYYHMTFDPIFISLCEHLVFSCGKFDSKLHVGVSQ